MIDGCNENVAPDVKLPPLIKKRDDILLQNESTMLASMLSDGLAGGLNTIHYIYPCTPICILSWLNQPYFAHWKVQLKFGELRIGLTCNMVSDGNILERVDSLF